MTSDCVPDFHDMVDDYDVPTSSSFSRPKKTTLLGEEDLMELMWENGKVVVQRTSTKKSSVTGVEPAPVRPTNNEDQQQEHRLFMQEDEMASWLHYPLEDSDFYADILYSAPPPPPPVPVTAAEPSVTDRSGILPGRSSFGPFSTILNRPVVEEMAAPAVDSSVAKEVHPVARSLQPVNTESGVSGRPGGIRRKRKDKEGEDSRSQSAIIEFEAAEAKKQAPGSSSTKRSRAAEVHSLSERRRRDRINEKMKALQQLIPRCNKSDKASMLDEAIEYLKSLQTQVQMMSMGYGVMPLMYPGMQQYMPPMGMGMGMGMGMDVGMNRPMVPYPSMVQGSGISNPAVGAHMGPRFPMPAYNLPPVRIPDPSRINASNQADPMQNSRMTNFVDPYQQFLGLQQAHSSLPPNQLIGRANMGNVNTSQQTGNCEHQQNANQPPIYR